MFSFIKTSGICIPREYESFEFYKNIRNKLIRHSKEYQRSTFVTNHYYVEGPNVLKVPRFFPIEEFVDDYEIIDKNKEGNNIKINHNITLRDDLQKNIVNYMLTNNNGIIQANPGAGKTVVSIYAISELKKKTFILVHRDSLVSQWMEGSPEKRQGFLEYTDIDKNEIGRLSSSNYKDVLNKSIILCTDQTFISLLKRDREEFLIELNIANIGVFLADEVHTTVGAPTFAECSIHVPSNIVFGLSATPYRYDGNVDVIKFHLGEIFVPEGKSSTMDGSVTVILFDSGLLPKSRGFLYYGGMFQKSRYLTILKNSKIFMGICLSLIKKFYNDDKKVLFIGERIKILELLKSQCGINDVGMFVGSSKLDQIENKITMSTPGKSRDGIDYVSKDCLIMSSPISNVDQMTGRVLRIKPGKKQPVIIDMVDINVKDIRQTAFSRLDFYLKKGWSIKYLFIDSNGNKRVLSEQEVMNTLKGK